MDRKEFVPIINSSMMADKQDILAALSKKDRILLDCRDKAEWIGKSSSPFDPDFCPRKGRIPGAIWLEWYQVNDSFNE